LENEKTVEPEERQPDTVESGEEPLKEDGKPAKKKKMPPGIVWMLRIVVGFVVIFAEVLLSYTVVTRFLMPQEKASVDESVEEKKTEPAPVPEKIITEASDGPAAQEKPFPSVIGGVYSLNDVIVNPAFSQGQSYFITSIVFAFDDKVKVDLMKERELILKDRIIALLSKKTTSWLSNYSNREILRKELLTIACTVLEANSGIYVYYTKYVIQ